jgi:hypothetical protein
LEGKFESFPLAMFQFPRENRPSMNILSSLCLDELSHHILILQHLQAVRFLICFLISLWLNEPKFLWPLPLPLPSFPPPPPFLRGRRQPHVRPQQLSQGSAEGRLIAEFHYLPTEFQLSLRTRLIKIKDDLQQAIMWSRLVFYGSWSFQQPPHTQRPEDIRSA